MLIENKRFITILAFFATCNRNVLKATIDVPQIGEVNFHCTHLDHLDEDWRMKQIKAIIQSDDGPHILAGGLNSLDETDYSTERWMDIVKVCKVYCDIADMMVVSSLYDAETIFHSNLNEFLSASVL